jgi:hypothetical protein
LEGHPQASDRSDVVCMRLTVILAVCTSLYTPQEACIELTRERHDAEGFDTSSFSTHGLGGELSEGQSVL